MGKTMPQITLKRADFKSLETLLKMILDQVSLPLSDRETLAEWQRLLGYSRNYKRFTIIIDEDK